MPESNPEDDALSREASRFLEPNLGLAMVVGNSPINRVVVVRIAERIGMTALNETPENAAPVILSRRPGTIILDGGPDDRDCDEVMECIASQRLAMGGRVPFVILLSNTNPAPGESFRGSSIDAVVAKPITPERLQPLIRDMMDRLDD